MKAVIYARYSSSGQREESIEGQLRECYKYAERNGIQVIGTYIDRAKTAKTADNRSNFQKMIKDSAKRQFDYVLVWKLDRFARDRFDSAHYKHALKKNGVRVLSATEAISQGAEGIILESVLEGMAEYYSVELAEKVIRGQTDNALDCRFNGGTVPIGYVINKEKHFEINPDTSPFVLEAFEMYDSGETMQTIADHLNAKGLRNTRGTKLNVNGISTMLTNRRYIGEYAYREIVTPNGIPAIVPEDLFYRVQKKIEINRKSPGKHRAVEDYILSTKLYCGKCMTFMLGESGTSRNKTTYRYYKCYSAKRDGKCDKKAVKKDWIEDIVINQILEVIWDDKLIDDLTRMVMEYQRKESSTLKLLNENLRDVKSSISNILKAIEKGIFTDSTKERLDELEEQRKELEGQISKEKIEHPLLEPDYIKYWFYRFRKMDSTLLKNRQKLVDCFVNSIVLYDDRIEFFFNFRKGANILSLEELEKGSCLFDTLPIEWNLNLKRDHFTSDVGTEELSHLEMIGAIVYQLTRNLSEDEIKKSGFDAYFVDHTTGVYPSSAAGVPFTAAYIQSKGDVITDMTENLAAEQKARTTYDNILRLVDDPDVREPIKFLRAREIVHFQRFGEGLRLATDKLDEKNFYAFNPSFDKHCNK